MEEIYLSKGNRRMDFPTFSLPSIKSCPNATKHCRTYCYAKKAEDTWKGPTASRARNYKLSKRNSFVKDMSEELKKVKAEYIRIHESGDFYNQTYLDKWISIMNNFKDKKFLIYTQMYELDWSNIPDNAIIYWSVWDDSKGIPKKGLRAYVIDDGSGKLNPRKTKRLDKAKLCTKGKGSSLKCNDCMYCYRGLGDVKFKLH